MLVRWTPFQETDRLAHAMTRLFEGDYASRRSAAQTHFTPAVDVREDTGKIVIVADLPGLKEKDVDIQIEKDLLTLRGERTLDREESEEQYRRYERISGTFVRTFTLPPTVDTDKVAAELRDGVLTLTLPKKPEAQPKKIAVKVQ